MQLCIVSNKFLKYYQCYEICISLAEIKRKDNLIKLGMCRPIC